MCIYSGYQADGQRKPTRPSLISAYLPHTESLDGKCTTELFFLGGTFMYARSVSRCDVAIRLGAHCLAFPRKRNSDDGSFAILGENPAAA